MSMDTTKFIYLCQSLQIYCLGVQLTRSSDLLLFGIDTKFKPVSHGPTCSRTPWGPVERCHVASPGNK